VQYADFSIWQENWLKSEDYRRQLSYWKEKLTGQSPYLDLPTDFVRSLATSDIGASISLKLEQTLINQLTSAGRKDDASLYMVLLAAFNVLLSKRSRSNSNGNDNGNDISIGTPIAGRNFSEVEGLIGFFVNTVVLRTEFEDNSLFSDWVQRVKKTALDGFENQGVPFGRVKY